jgi:hypothetical protein
MKQRRRLALRLLGVLLLVGVVGLLAWSWWSRQHLKSRLAQKMEELDRTDPGWRLADLEAARPEVPEAKNSAHVIVAARKLLPRSGWRPVELANLLHRLVPNQRLTPEQAERLANDLDAVGPAVREARRLKDMPRGRHRLDIGGNPLGFLLPDQQETRSIASLLRDDALRRTHERDMKGALESCRGVLNAGRSLDDEPTGISQLIRIACVLVACDCLERVLAQGEAEEEDLAAMQALLELEDRHPTLLILCRGERALSHATFEGLERGTINLSDLGQGGGDLKRRFSYWWAARQVRGEHPHMLELLTQRVEAARLPLHEQGEADRQFTATMRALPERAALTRLLVPALEKFSDAARRKAALVRSAIVLVAVERYRRAHDRWPRKLADLTPKYLAAVPLDPYDGKPLRFRRLPDGVVIYSVGPDLVDHGGTLDRENPLRPGTDLGCQLWDVSKRRQKPRPAPAGGAPRK